MDLDEEIEKVVNEYGEAIVDAVRQSLANSRKVASGDLQNSVQYDVKDVSLEIWANDYLKWVEGGAEWPVGKRPPIQAILDWIEAKGIVANGITSRNVNNTKTGKTRVRRDGVDISQKKAAFAIAHSIAERGIKPTGIVKPIINELQDSLMENISQKVANVLGETIAEDWRSKADDKLNITINY